MDTLPPITAGFPISQGSPRGSQWNKWDLHVHTPASVVQYYGDSFQEKTWEEYFCALEALPPEIKAIGINDYFLLDGYRRVLKAKESGRLANIELILPVVELRVESFSGHRELRKINFHAIFSDELTPDQIETFFLNMLGLEFELNDGETWRGKVCHRAGLEAFGKAIRESTPLDKRPSLSDIQIGFNNAAFPLDRVREELAQSVFDNKVITAVGLSEWDDLRWDSSGGAVKKKIINGADLIFTASPSPTKFYERRAQLQNQNVNARLIDCSDAHHYSSSDQPIRLGNVYSWLKADLTFAGLQRVIQRYEERVFVGDLGVMPTKREHIQKNKRRYIQSIEIRKKSDSSLVETWFDCEIPLNSDLVAIIGSQGNGKSALSDIIALCGNTKIKEFSFLTTDKFCDKENKASHFEAKLVWEDGTSTRRCLDELVDPNEVELVRYVPQRFFDLVTNETVVKEGGRFYGEIKKAVFSRIAQSDRLGSSNLDELIQARTDGDHAMLQILRQELQVLNRDIVALELASTPSEVQRLNKAIESKRAEITAHESSKPPAVENSSESTEVTVKIDELRTQEEKIQKELDVKNDELGRYKKQRQFLTQKKQAIDNEQRRIQGFKDGLLKDFTNDGYSFDVETLISVTVDTSQLSQAVDNLNTQIADIEKLTDSSIAGTLAESLLKLRQERESLQDELQEASRAYQTYRTQLQEWESQHTALIGDSDSVDTLKWLESQLHDITTTLPLKLSGLKQERQEKSKEIHTQLMKLVSTYEDLTTRVQQHIKSDPLTRDKYRIEFAIQLVEHDIVDRLFDIVGHGAGTFSGIQDGRKLLQSLADKRDFASADAAVEFAEEILKKLESNHKVNPPEYVGIHRLLKKGRKREHVYDLLFGFEYLAPEYSLALNGKPLKQLSPGERGVLLLVFYLIVDQSDEPLIIDQPEGNLNNQSIFDNLVPVFIKAKEKRQIIVVTHNPNLAVVCDAEQIVHAQIDFNDGNRVRFDSGSLENPRFNKLSLDVLEGTTPAFDARRQTYQTYRRA